MIDVDLFGEPIDCRGRKETSEDKKKKRRWEDGFQRWCDKQADDGSTHYGVCGFGVICNYCADSSYGRPCVRALNTMLREKRKELDYEHVTYEQAFDGG